MSGRLNNAMSIVHTNDSYFTVISKVEKTQIRVNTNNRALSSIYLSFDKRL